MNNIALSIVLFVVFLSVVSCAIYQPKTLNISPQEKYKPIEQEIEQMLDEIYEVTPTEEEIAPFEILEVEDASMPTQKDKKKKVSSSLKTSKTIDIAQLSLRHARVACGVLGIKQKVNDHDCNLSWMQKQINQRVKENPEKISEVYKAIVLQGFCIDEKTAKIAEVRPSDNLKKLITTSYSTGKLRKNRGNHGTLTNRSTWS